MGPMAVDSKARLGWFVDSHFAGKSLDNIIDNIISFVLKTDRNDNKHYSDRTVRWTNSSAAGQSLRII